MKTPHLLFVFAVTAIFLLAACGGAAPPEPAPVAEQPPAAEPPAPAEPAPAEPPQPTEPVSPPEPTQPQFAPFCESASAGCEAPTIEMLDNKYCVEKVPYAIMSVPAGSTYESLDPDLQCIDQMHSDGNLRITCNSVTSKQLWSYEIKVCNSSCSAPALQTGTGQCPDGYGLDSSNQCCAAPVPSGSDGCVTYQVDLGACPGG